MADTEKKPGFFARMSRSIRDMKGELKKVVWPSKKQIINNTMVVLAYVVVVNVLGIPDIMEEFGSFGQYSALVLLAFGNIFFVIYDYTVGNLTAVYRDYFAPKFLRRGGR